MTDLAEARRELALANNIVANEGVLDAFGHVSMRHPDYPNRYLLSRSRAPELVTADDFIEYHLDFAAGARHERCPIFRAGDPRRNLQGAAGREFGMPSPCARFHAAARHPHRLRAGLRVSAPLAAASRRSGISVTNSAIPICWWSSRRRAPRLPARLAHHWMVLMNRHGVTVAGTSVRECVFRSIYGFAQRGISGARHGARVDRAVHAGRNWNSAPTSIGVTTG